MFLQQQQALSLQERESSQLVLYVARKHSNSFPVLAALLGLGLGFLLLLVLKKACLRRRSSEISVRDPSPEKIQYKPWEIPHQDLTLPTGARVRIYGRTDSGGDSSLR